RALGNLLFYRSIERSAKESFTSSVTRDDYASGMDNSCCVRRRAGARSDRLAAGDPEPPRLAARALQSGFVFLELCDPRLRRIGDCLLALAGPRHFASERPAGISLRRSLRRPMETAAPAGVAGLRLLWAARHGVGARLRLWCCADLH